MRQERIDFSGRSGADPDKYIFHPDAEVDAVCLACRRHALHDRQMLAAGFAAGEQPVFASERDGANHIFPCCQCSISDFSKT